MSSLALARQRLCSSNGGSGSGLLGAAASWALEQAEGREEARAEG